MEVISWIGALCWNDLCILWQKGKVMGENDYLHVIADALTVIADVLKAQEQRELDRIKAEEEAEREAEERKAAWVKSLDKMREYPFEE